MAKIFILGATGYVGGSLLISLKKAYPDCNYTALVRSEADFAAISAAGATPVRGSFTDHELIASLSADADVVVNAADGVDIALSSSILRGLKRRKEEGRGVGAFIHTGGGTIFLDDRTDGKYNPNLKVWTDSEEDIRALTPSMFHGDVETSIMKASEEGYVNSFIVCPPIVYGKGTGPVRQSSVFFKYVLKSCNISERKEMIYIGEGTNVNTIVHIEDLIEAYLLIFNLALNAGPNPLTSSAYTRYYIITSGAVPVVWKELVRLFAIELHKRGSIKTPIPVSVAYQDAGSFNWFMSKNSAMRPGRILELGWRPKHVELSDSTFADDVSEALKEM